jgi:hypothetical protein
MSEDVVCENPTSPRMTSMHQAENPSNSPVLLTFEQKMLSHVSRHHR